MSLAADLEQQAAQLRRQAEAFVKQAEALEEAAAKIRASEAGSQSLPPRTLYGTVSGDMLTTGQIEAAKQMAVDRKGTLHPFQSWIYERDVKLPGPRSLADAAEALKLGEEQVRSWCRTNPEQRRRVPQDIAKQIEDAWGYKATPANWPNGIKGPPKNRR